MRQPPRELVVDDAISRMPAGAGFVVALALTVPVYLGLALLV